MPYHFRRVKIVSCEAAADKHISVSDNPKRFFVPFRADKTGASRTEGDF
jgi:hypothetical protein